MKLRCRENREAEDEEVTEAEEDEEDEGRGFCSSLELELLLFRGETDRPSSSTASPGRGERRKEEFRKSGLIVVTSFSCDELETT